VHISNPPAYHTLDRRTVAEIQRKVIKRSGRNPVSRLLHSKDDAGAIAAWKVDLNRILQVFNVSSCVPARLPLTLPFRLNWL